MDSMITRVALVRAAICAASMLFATVVCGQPAQAPATSAAGSDWPQFLGPDRNGLSPETGLIVEWGTDGPPELWRAPGGIGMSGLAIAGGKLVTLVQKSGRQWALCLNAQTGKPIWEMDVAPAYRNAMGDGPRATPSIAGDAAYILTGEGILAALKLADGQILWKKDVVAELGGKPAEYGMAGSPLVLGDRIVIVIGTSKATVAALTTARGNVVWTAGADQPAGYSSPVVLKIADREQLVAFHGSGAVGLDPKAGTELWSYPYVTDFNCNIANPLAVAGGVLLSAGENHGSVLLSFKPHSEKFDVAEVWKSQGASSVLRNEWQTSVQVSGQLYGFDNVGSAGPVTHLTCIDAASGNRRWQQQRFGKGNLIAADGKLFISTMQGELVVARVNPAKYDELGRKTVVGKTRQAPALSRGLLYLRDDREIICLDARNH